MSKPKVSLKTQVLVQDLDYYALIEYIFNEFEKKHKDTNKSLFMTGFKYTTASLNMIQLLP